MCKEENDILVFVDECMPPFSSGLQSTVVPLGSPVLLHKRKSLGACGISSQMKGAVPCCARGKKQLAKT